MKLIARKPCSFGGRNFFIGEEVPADLVLDPKRQESIGILSIVSGSETKAKPVAGTSTDKAKKTRGGKAKAAGGH